MVFSYDSPRIPKQRGCVFSDFFLSIFAGWDVGAYVKLGNIVENGGLSLSLVSKYLCRLEPAIGDKQEYSFEILSK